MVHPSEPKAKTRQPLQQSFAVHHTVRDGLRMARYCSTGSKAFPLLLGIPEGACSGVFIAENAHRCDALDYTYRENALVASLAETGWSCRYVQFNLFVRQSEKGPRDRSAQNRSDDRSHPEEP